MAADLFLRDAITASTRAAATSGGGIRIYGRMTGVIRDDGATEPLALLGCDRAKAWVNLPDRPCRG
jgi:hypothetical protein